MHLTPEALEAAYSFLLATPPFKGWRMPRADEVEFRVMVDRHNCGQHVFRNGRHRVDISTALHAHTCHWLMTLAHEMIHVAQAASGTDTCGVEHNKDFLRRVKAVCRSHGFDPKVF